MFKPNEEKSERTRALLSAVFEQVENAGKYTQAYAYFIKSGIFGQKVSTYAVGFSPSDKELVVIPMDSEGESGDALVLPASSIKSAKMDMQGGVKIKSDLLKDDLRFIVPPYTSKALEDAYILPIIQEDEASQFKAFIKDSF